MIRDLVRVMFSLQPATWHEHASERLWAKEVATGRYQLKNSPFYAYDVSFEDIVFASPDERGQLVYTGISIRSGHSTYRLLLKKPIDSTEFHSHWMPLELAGCSYEGKGGRLLAVDVPGSTDIHRVYALLQDGERSGVWDFEEAHRGHID